MVCTHTHTANPVPRPCYNQPSAMARTEKDTLRRMPVQVQPRAHKHREAYRPSLLTSSGVLWFLGLHLKVLLLSEQTKLRPKTVQ